MSEREKLIADKENEIKDFLNWSHGVYSTSDGKEFVNHYRTDCRNVNELAIKLVDEILADRKRIVEPLVKYITHAVDKKDGNIHPENYNWYIREAIENAGVEL